MTASPSQWEVRGGKPCNPAVFPCRAMPMAIQFSILIMLHAALVLITTAEDYKCLPLVLRKTCCWINETYLARNVIIFSSILINFLGAILNIVSIPGLPTLQCPGCSRGGSGFVELLQRLALPPFMPVTFECLVQPQA